MSRPNNLYNRTNLLSARPLFSRKALFSDTTENYVFPSEPTPFDRVTIRFRTKKNNADKVYLIHNDERILMDLVQTDELFDFYETKVQLENEAYSYCFYVEAGKVDSWFDQRGPVSEAGKDYFFTIIPGFSVPDWAKGAVMYQIYTDRFCNGDESNDVLDREYHYLGGPSLRVPGEQWYREPSLSAGVREFYGGDLQGVINKLDYLRDLGIEVIYFNPLFVSPSNHKYDTQDYEHIDPHFGKIVVDEGELLAEGDYDNRHATKHISRVTDQRNLEASDALFATLVKEAHKRGIRVIIDGVFNHCGSFNKWLDREKLYQGREGYAPGAYITGDSPYRDFFLFQNPHAWPDNGTYDGWWGHDTLPKLHYGIAPELWESIMRVAEKWVSPPYNADGWRLDVAADLGTSPEINHLFWKEFRQRVRNANPNAIVLAEHYGDAKPWLNGKEWDTVMNYDAFMEPVTWYLTGMQKHSDDYRGDLLCNLESFWGAMYYHGARMTNPSKEIAMNELSNHDHSRFLTRTNRKVGRANNLGQAAASEGIDKAVMREAVLLQMTWPGAPTVYYGDEAGVCGFTDPDNRRTYPWGREDQELLSFHKQMIALHKERSEFRTGSLKRVKAGDNLLAYGRFNDNSRSLIVINNTEETITQDISVWALGIPRESALECRMKTTREGFSVTRDSLPVAGGHIVLTLEPKSAVVYCQDGSDKGTGFADRKRERRQKKDDKFFHYWQM